MSRLHIVFLIAFTLIGPGVQAEKFAPQRFDESEWKSLRQSYQEEEKEVPVKKETPDRKNRTSNVMRTSTPIVFGGEIRIILYVVFAIILILLIWFFVKAMANNGAFRKNKKIDYDLEDAEENLNEAPLERMLREHLAKKNYMVALRLSYLMVIKELSEQGRIHWHRYKTNYDYINELGQDAISVPLQEVTVQYEQVWYGEKNLDVTGYNTLKARLDGLIQKIKSVEE